MIIPLTLDEALSRSAPELSSALCIATRSDVAESVSSRIPSTLLSSCLSRSEMSLPALPSDAESLFSMLFTLSSYSFFTLSMPLTLSSISLSSSFLAVTTSVAEVLRDSAVDFRLSLSSVCVAIDALSFATIGSVIAESSGLLSPSAAIASLASVYELIVPSTFTATVSSVSATALASPACVSNAESSSFDISS